MMPRRLVRPIDHGSAHTPKSQRLSPPAHVCVCVCLCVCVCVCVFVCLFVWGVRIDRMMRARPLQVRKHGRCWSKMAEMLPGRTGHSIKNRYNSVLILQFHPDGTRREERLRTPKKKGAYMSTNRDDRQIAHNTTNRSTAAANQAAQVQKTILAYTVNLDLKGKVASSIWPHGTPLQHFPRVPHGSMPPVPQAVSVGKESNDEVPVALPQPTAPADSRECTTSGHLNLSHSGHALPSLTRTTTKAPSQATSMPSFKRFLHLARPVPSEADHPAPLGCFAALRPARDTDRSTADCSSTSSGGTEGGSGHVHDCELGAVAKTKTGKLKTNASPLQVAVNGVGKRTDDRVKEAWGGAEEHANCYVLTHPSHGIEPLLVESFCPL